MWALEFYVSVNCQGWSWYWVFDWNKSPEGPSGSVGEITEWVKSEWHMYEKLSLDSPTPTLKPGHGNAPVTLVCWWGDSVSLGFACQTVYPKYWALESVRYSVSKEKMESNWGRQLAISGLHACLQAGWMHLCTRHTHVHSPHPCTIIK